VAWHARESLTGGRRDGSKLAQVSHGRGRGAGWVECKVEQLVRSGHVMVYERACEREWRSNYTSQKVRVIEKLKMPRYRYKSGELVYRSGNGVQNRYVR